MSDRRVLNTAVLMSVLTLAGNAAALVMAFASGAPWLVVALALTTAAAALLALSLLAFYRRSGRAAMAETPIVAVAVASTEAAAGGLRAPHRRAPAVVEAVPEPPPAANVVRFPRSKRTPE